jgi:hypothetical protein
MLEVRSVAESELEGLRSEVKAALDESGSSTATIKQAVAKLILDADRMQVRGRCHAWHGEWQHNTVC